MTLLTRLGLGTAQFGHHYGISNRGGPPTAQEIASILRHAAAAGIGYIDTAPAYGNAEELLGRQMPTQHRFRIVTKAPKIIDEAISKDHAQVILDSVARSLERLRVDRVYALIVHDADDLRKAGWEHVVEALRRAKERGWATRIGASIYDAEQLALVESRFRPELIQLPLNALDRRMAACGALDRLKAFGIEVHARSSFLQGMLLMDVAELPEFFSSLRRPLAELHARWAAEGMTSLAGCLDFVLQQKAVDAVIVGVNCGAELDGIIAAVNRARFVNPGDALAVDHGLLDPRRWPASVQ